MGLQSIVRWLLPRADQFYDYLERQVALADNAARAVLAFAESGTGDMAELADTIQAFEHEGDRVVHGLEEELAKTFVTPIDREDLQRLSVDLDDILDFTNAFTRSAVLYGVARPSPAMTELISSLAASVATLVAAMPDLRRARYAALLETVRAVRQHEKAADLVYRHEISRLFHDFSVNPRELIRQKVLLDAAEDAVDCAEQAAATLSSIAIKHA